MNINKLSKVEWLDLALSLLFFCLLALGQLQRWQVTPTLAIYGHDVVAILIILLNWRWWSTEMPSLARHFSLQRYWPLLILAGWAATGWILALLSGQSLISAVLYLARLLTYAALNWQLLHERWSKAAPWLKPSERLLGLYWLVGVYLMAIGFLQYLLIPDVRFLGTFGWDVHLYRLVSVQLDPNLTGALLLLTLLLTLNLRFLRPLVRQVLAVIMMGSIALTYSRSTYGAVILGLLSWAFIKRPQKKQVMTAISLLVVLAVMILYLPRPSGEGVRLERTASGIARVETAQSALSDLRPVAWLIGQGLFVPGNFSEPSQVILGQHARLADNIIILVTTGLGVGGLLLLIIILYRYRRVLGQLSLLATASSIAILAHSQFNNTLFQPFVWLMITAIILTSFKYQED